MICEPWRSRQSQTRSTNASRPMSRRDVPSPAELLLDLRLGGDAGVVGAHDPARRLAAHAVEADQRVLDRAVERMAHVEDARDVRRRHRDREVLARLRPRARDGNTRPPPTARRCAARPPRGRSESCSQALFGPCRPPRAMLVWASREPGSGATDQGGSDEESFRNALVSVLAFGRKRPRSPAGARRERLRGPRQGRGRDLLRLRPPNDGKTVKKITGYFHFKCDNGKEGSIPARTDGSLKVKDGKFEGEDQGAEQGNGHLRDHAASSVRTARRAAPSRRRSRISYETHLHRPRRRRVERQEGARTSTLAVSPI